MFVGLDVVVSSVVVFCRNVQALGPTLKRGADKDGMLMQTKYEVMVKTARHASGTSHCVLFMNSHPDFSKLSLDRWHIIEDLSDDRTIFDLFPPDRFPDVSLLADPFEGCADGSDGVIMIDTPDAPEPKRRRSRRALGPTPRNLALSF